LRRSIIAGGLIALAACSGDPSGTNGAGDNQSIDARSAAGSSQSLEQITIATNPAGTHVYAVAAGLAKVLQDDETVRATIRPFSGSSVYLPQLQRGEIAVGLNTSIDSFLSYRGLAPWEEPMTNLRALGMMFPLPIMYMVRADSDIFTVEDLRNKRVVVTFRANASLAQLHEGILATGGISLDDVTQVTVAGLPDAMRMLTEGRADAVPTGLNTALTLQVDSAVPSGIRYIQMGQDEARLSEIMPGSRVVTVEPDDNGVGLSGPTRVSGILDYLNTGVHMSDDQAYQIMKTIHENWESLRRDYIQMRPVAADEIVPVDLTHPFHPGAIRYYKEVGLWTEQHEANQAALLALHP
jgi:TRAP transporter TAXI family solute receptor